MGQKRGILSAFFVILVISSILLFSVRPDDSDSFHTAVHGSSTSDGLDRQSIQHDGIFSGSGMEALKGRQLKGNTLRTAAVFLAIVLFSLDIRQESVILSYMKTFLSLRMRFLFEISILQKKDGKKRAAAVL